MNGPAFIAWRHRMGWNMREAMTALDLSRLTVMRYESGAHPIPRHTALACWALEMQRWPFARMSWEQFERGEVPAITE